MLNQYKSIFVLSAISAICITLSLNTGCKPKQISAEEQQAETEQMVNTTFDEIGGLIEKQDFAAAEKLVTKALADEKYAGVKDRLANQMVELLTQQGKTAEAETFILATLKSDPASASQALSSLFYYYSSSKLFDKSITLSGRILDSDTELPENMNSFILSERFSAAVQMGDPDIEKSILKSIMTSVKDSGTATRIIQPSLVSLLRKKKFEEAMFLSNLMKNSDASDENYKNLAAVITIQCVIGTQNWDELKPVFADCVMQLPDGELTKLMRFVFSALQKEKMNDMLKDLAMVGINSPAEKQKSIDYAARKWVEVRFAEDKNSLVASLKKLQSTKTTPNQICSIFDRFFYEVASDKKLVKDLCSIGPDLISKCTDDNTANSLKVKILDGAFIIEDYDLAVSMLEKGIPGKDPAWHAMSLPKVKAHRAQAQNNPREAVKYYREFMACWETSEKTEEFDPTSGIAYSKEWILARNANRIAGILDSIPDKAEADKAREEARTYFKVAIEKAKEDEAALKLVTEEAAKLQ